MKIVVCGHIIETTDIYDIVLITTTRNAAVVIKQINKPDVTIGKSIPYETRHGEFREYWDPYEKLYNDVKAKWEADKTELPIFKL